MHAHTRRAIQRALLILVSSAAVAAAHAQRDTEMFVPIGQSPGQSPGMSPGQSAKVAGKTTLIGTIEAIDQAQNTMSVKDATGSVLRVQTAAQTRQWLDRSAKGQPNRKATAADFRLGMTVEVKYRDNDRAAGLADWVKLQATE